MKAGGQELCTAKLRGQKTSPFVLWDHEWCTVGKGEREACKLE